MTVPPAQADGEETKEPPLASVVEKILGPFGPVGIPPSA
jgi:hypothetical protein